MATFNVGAHTYETRDVAPSGTAPGYTPPPGAPPVGEADSSWSYANPREQAAAEAMAKVLSGLRYSSIEGEGEDAVLPRFHAQHADARKILGDSMVVSDDRLQPYQRTQGMDPKDSGYVLNELLKKAYGGNAFEGSQRDVDLMATNATKVMRKGPSVGPVALAQALSDMDVMPGSVGENYFDQMSRDFQEYGSSSAEDNPSKIHQGGPDGKGYATLADFLSNFKSDMAQVAPVNVFGTLGLPNFLGGFWNSVKFGNPFGPGYGQMDSEGNVIPGTWKGGAGYSEGRSPFTGPGGNTGQAGKGTDGPSGGGGGIST